MENQKQGEKKEKEKEKRRAGNKDSNKSNTSHSVSQATRGLSCINDVVVDGSFLSILGPFLSMRIHLCWHISWDDAIILMSDWLGFIIWLFIFILVSLVMGQLLY